MDDVFALLDRTESSIGSAAAVPPASPGGWRRGHSTPSMRSSRACLADARSARAGADRARPPCTSRRPITSIVSLSRTRWYGERGTSSFRCGALAMCGAVAGVLLRRRSCFAAVFGFVVNWVIRVVIARRIGGEIVWFRQVGPLHLRGAGAVGARDEETAAITGSMVSDLAALRRLGAHRAVGEPGSARDRRPHGGRRSNS